MKVFVGISGGVDSSVTAYLLQQQGHEVVGVYMKNWSGNVHTDRGDFRFPCSAEADWQDALRAAEHLGIPLYTFDFEEEYREKVTGYFIKEIAEGRTPNPDVMCNKEIKFKVFLDKCLKLGADKIATGHYARVEAHDGKFFLKKGVDITKDQSYFLCTLAQHELSHTLFPVGEYTKPQIRQIALDIGLPNAKKPDSQGICFVGEIDVNEFIEAFVGEKPGDIVTTDGEVIGSHRGIYFHTIGQRKGLGIGGGIPYFVVAKDKEKNQLIVAKGMNPEELFTDSVIVTDVTWTVAEPELPQTFGIKVRYRSRDVEGIAEKIDDNSLQVTFTDKQRAITEGQFLVLYKEDMLIGSGIMK